jgi:membrane protein DedA with SNARE-associated domain
MFGIEFSEAGLIEFFGQYAYRPGYVYTFIICFMFASSFGFPIPEELVLVSSGLVAYMAQHPLEFPPPYPGAEGVNLMILSLVCFLAVFGSDFIVFLLGRFFGTKIIKTRFFKKQVAGQGFDRINSWFQKYGGWACGIFRFTPGLRFPGHLSCGLLGIPIWKFCAIDGLAALISVPTQVWFVANYGGQVLRHLREFKLIILGVFVVLFLVWLGRRIYLKNTRSSHP